MTKSPDVLVRRIGHEGEPVAVIDHFVPDPEALRAFAAKQTYESAGRHYPGIKASLPEDYLRECGGLIGTILREVFGIRSRVSVLEARFSIVTAAPDMLSVEQRLPHVDALEPGRLALIHYLVPAGTEGTAFYRHRSTGFETIDDARSRKYRASLSRDIEIAGPPDERYLFGDSALFEQTGAITGHYNRALLYRSRMLHSGIVTPDAALSADPATGRLTITGFFAA